MSGSKIYIGSGNKIFGESSCAGHTWAGGSDASNANKTTEMHTVEDDFQHYLSYSGHWKDSAEIIALLRDAYEAAWRPAAPNDLTNQTTELEDRGYIEKKQSGK